MTIKGYYPDDSSAECRLSDETRVIVAASVGTRQYEKFRHKFGPISAIHIRVHIDGYFPPRTRMCMKLWIEPSRAVTLQRRFDCLQSFFSLHALAAENPSTWWVLVASWTQILVNNLIMQFAWHSTFAIKSMDQRNKFIWTNKLYTRANIKLLLMLIQRMVMNLLF